MNFATPFKYGAIGGALLIAIAVLMYLVYPTFFASSVNIIIALPIIFFMTWGSITYRRELGNNIGFGRIYLSIIIIVTLMLFLNLLFQYVLMNYIDPDLPILIKRKAIESARDWAEKLGQSEEQVEQGMQAAESMEVGSVGSISIKFGMGMLAYGLLALLITLFVMRNPDRVKRPEFDEEGNYIKPDNSGAN